MSSGVSQPEQRSCSVVVWSYGTSLKQGLLCFNPAIFCLKDPVKKERSLRWLQEVRNVVEDDTVKSATGLVPQHAKPASKN